ncbi:hypothetical protein [Azospirillum sp. sgz301742]
MANEHGPKKVGVYGGPGAAAGLNWTWIVVGLIVLAIILYFVLR